MAFARIMKLMTLKEGIHSSYSSEHTLLTEYTWLYYYTTCMDKVISEAVPIANEICIPQPLIPHLSNALFLVV